MKRQSNGAPPFPAKTLQAARNAATVGVQVLCIHLDAGAGQATDKLVRDHKLDPAVAHVQQHAAPDVCVNLVPLLPVREMEAWMLADKDLLRQKLGTTWSDQQLNLTSHPERCDPKAVILMAITAVKQAQRKRLRPLKTEIDDLCAPMGDQLGLDKLAALGSYQTFREAVRTALEQLGYLH